MNRSTFTAITIATLLSACASDPVTQTGPEAETTFDGLVRVDNAAFAAVWIRPERDFDHYTAIIPRGAGIEYRDVRQANTQRGLSTADEFPISEANRSKIQEIAQEVFAEELAKSERFEITDTPGAGVLLLEAALLDVVATSPPTQQQAGRGNTYVSSFGEATLVLELRDSTTNETLIRAAERRSIEPVGGGASTLRVSNSVTAQAETRRVMRRWATTLRQRLDAVPDLDED